MQIFIFLLYYYFPFIEATVYAYFHKELLNIIRNTLKFLLQTDF